MAEISKGIVEDARRIITVIRKHLEEDEEGKSNLREILKEALSEH